MVYNFFGKRTSDGTVKNENTSDLPFAEKLRKTIIRKFNKRKVESPFIHNILDVNLADMQLISKFNERSRFLFCAINFFSKYSWVIHRLFNL